MRFQLRQARFATSILFLVHGIVVASWVSRIPAAQSSLSLRPGVLGLALLGVALGSLVAMPPTGALIDRYGSRRCAAVTTLAFCVALALIGVAHDFFSLTGLLFLYGATAGAMDVSMNAQGVTVERQYGRTIMSGLHALFSLGAMIGAFTGGVLAAQGISMQVHLAWSGLVCSVAGIAAAGLLLGPEHEREHAGGPMFALPRGPVLGLGVLAFCILLCEGAIADWTAIFLRDFLRAGPAAAASGFAVFSAAMAIGRFAGDVVTDRFGAERLIVIGSLVAAAGISLTLASPGLLLALAGLLAAGFGYAAIVPNVFGSAGRIPGIPPGAGIAAVTTMGFTGFLAGPPVIGWLAEWTSLRIALGVLVLLSLAGAALARSIRHARAPRDMRDAPV